MRVGENGTGGRATARRRAGAFAAMLLFFAASCRRDPDPQPDARTGSRTATPAGTPPQVAPAGGGTVPSRPAPFPAPRFTLTDAAGGPFESDRLAGQAWVIGFLPANGAADGSIWARFSELERRARRWPDGEKLALLSVAGSMTPDAIRRLAESPSYRDAETGRWTILQGEGDALDRLRAGLRRPEATAGDRPTAAAGDRLVMVDARGRVRGDFDARSDEEFGRLAAELRSVLSESVAGANAVTHVGEPADVFDPPWLEARRREQIAARHELAAFHDFAFVDRVRESGIRFVNRAVADATRDFKTNHYDHANGVAAADVDGDGLPDLYFTNQVGGNQLWRNAGGGRFVDATAEAGVALAGRVSVSASFADADGDGDPDLFVTTTRHGNAFFVNEGVGRFRDATEEAGLAYSGHSSAADFFDYDGDGRLDLLVTNVGAFTTDEVAYNGDPAKRESPYFVGVPDAFGGHLYAKRSERSILYRNEGGNRFRDVSAETGLVDEGWAGDATPLDANGDGRVDLYVLNMQGNDELYLNREGVRFEKASGDAFSRFVWGGMGCKSFDYDNDGRTDLFVTNMHADMWRLGKDINGAEEKRRPPADVMPESYLRSRDPAKNVLGNALYRNVGGGRFEEVAERTGAETFWPWGLSVGDLNADGFQDVFVTSSMSYPFRYHVNSVLLNDGGRAFRDAEFILGVEPRRDGRTATPWFELDASGVDVHHKLSQSRSGRVVVWGAVGSRSSVILDVEGDGDLDVVTNDFNTEPMVLVSDLSERRDLRYVSIRLRGGRSNREGLAATVEVAAGGRTQTQVYDGQSGYLSQSSLPLYFGLGESSAVDRITVRWPSGTRQVLEGPVETNRQMTIVEEEGIATAPR